MKIKKTGRGINLIDCLSKEEQQILLHTLGWSNLQFYEKEKINKEPYRNYFYTNEKTTDYLYIESLIEKGLMVDSKRGWNKEDKSRYFYVTEKGISLARKLALKAIPKVSRSKKRYQLYLHSGCDESFGEWLKNEYWDDYRKRNGV